MSKSLDRSSFCTFPLTVFRNELATPARLGLWTPLQFLAHSSFSCLGHAESYLKSQETDKGTWCKHCLESKRNYPILLRAKNPVSLMKMTNIVKWICIPCQWLEATQGQSVFWCSWANKIRLQGLIKCSLSAWMSETAKARDKSNGDLCLRGEGLM